MFVKKVGTNEDLFKIKNTYVKIPAKSPCKNLANMYKLTFISVLAMKLEHWAKIDKPLKATKKLQSGTKRVKDILLIWLKLLHPIVISNNPLRKAETISGVILNGDNIIQTKYAIKSITLKNFRTSKNTENIITNPPIASNVFTPSTTALPNNTKNPSDFVSSYIILFISFKIVFFVLSLFSLP